MRGKGKAKVKVFTQRAWGLLSRMQAAQGQFRETCPDCGYKVRGPNHAEGIHHKTRHPKLRSAT